MSPCMSLDNVRDCRMHDVVLPRKNAIGRAVSVRLPDGDYLGFCQFAQAILRSALRTNWRRPSAFLTSHVSEIFRLRAKKEMRWIAAQRVVAAVTHALTNWDWAVGKEPRETVATPEFVGPPLLPVSMCAFGFRPQPAFTAGFVERIPEVLLSKMFHSMCVG